MGQAVSDQTSGADPPRPEQRSGLSESSQSLFLNLTASWEPQFSSSANMNMERCFQISPPLQLSHVVPQYTHATTSTSYGTPACLPGSADVPILA